MANSYSEKPNEGYSDYPSTSRSSTDPPDDFELMANDLPHMGMPTNDYAFSTSSSIMKVPPVPVFSFGLDPVGINDNLAPRGNNDAAGEIEMMHDSSHSSRNSHSSSARPTKPYSDNPDAHSTYHDGEFNSVYVDGSGNPNSPTNKLRRGYFRKTIGTCFLGFFLGIVMIVVFVLLTSDRGNGGGGLRLGAPEKTYMHGLDESDTSQRVPFVNVDDNADPSNSSMDGTIINGNQDAIAVWVSGESSSESAENNNESNNAENDEQPKKVEPTKTAENDESNQVNPDTVVVNEVDKTNESPASDDSEEASSVGTESNNENDANSETDNSEVGEDSGVVTIKIQEPPTSEQSEGPNDSSTKPAKEDESSAPGKDETQNEIPASSNQPPATTNEVINPAKDDQSNNAKAPQTTTSTSNNNNDNAAKTGEIPGGPRDNPDLDQYCGSCRWKSSSFTCDKRVEYFWEKYRTNKIEAKTTLMKQGHCPEVDGTHVKPLLNNDIIPTLDQCRERPIPGQKNFCVHCRWKGSDFSCYKRVMFLKATYGTPETEAMTTLMEQGYCQDDRTDEEKAIEKEQGLENWCDQCMFRAYSCRHRVTGGGTITNATAIIAAKLDLIINGQCLLPPFCDSMNSTESGGQ